MKINLSLVLPTFFGLVLFSSCKKDTIEPVPETPSTPTYTVPSTYDFANANFTSSTQRLAMLGEMTTYIRSTHTSTTATQALLDAQKLKDMYVNTGNVFADASLNSSGIQLKDKTSNEFSLQTILNSVYDNAQAASVYAAANPTTTTASLGVAGKIISPSRAILVDASGYELKELVEKGIMGGVLYYQATTMINKIADFDNIILVNGSSAQEKAWDEAFGYFGVPSSFPTNTLGLKYWGSYANSVNSAINCNTTIMNAFLSGRAAISNKDNEVRNASALIVISTWEKIAAAKCINYLKSAKTNIADKGTFHHVLTEGYGFITALQYNPAKQISNGDLNTLLSYFGSNLYNMSLTNIDNAINKLAAVYGLDTSKL